jgi:hypothetical protein
MNRRKFFGSLAKIAAATVMVPFGLSNGKRAPMEPTGVPINPFVYHKGLRAFVFNEEWKKAPYEIAFWSHEWSPAIKHRMTLPFRFRTAEDAQLFLSRLPQKRDC